MASQGDTRATTDKHSNRDAAVERLDQDAAELSKLWQKHSELMSRKDLSEPDIKDINNQLKELRGQIKEKQHAVKAQIKHTRRELKKDSKKASKGDVNQKLRNAQENRRCSKILQRMDRHDRYLKEQRKARKTLFSITSIKDEAALQTASDEFEKISSKIDRLNGRLSAPSGTQASAAFSEMQDMQTTGLSQEQKSALKTVKFSKDAASQILADLKGGNAVRVEIDGGQVITHPSGRVEFDKEEPITKEEAQQGLSIFLECNEKLEKGVDYTLDENGKVKEITKSGLDKLGPDWAPTPGMPASPEGLENLKAMQAAFLDSVPADLRDGVMARMDEQREAYSQQIAQTQGMTAGPSAATDAPAANPPSAPQKPLPQVPRDLQADSKAAAAPGEEAQAAAGAEAPAADDEHEAEVEGPYMTENNEAEWGTWVDDTRKWLSDQTDALDTAKASLGEMVTEDTPLGLWSLDRKAQITRLEALVSTCTEALDNGDYDKAIEKTGELEAQMGELEKDITFNFVDEHGSEPADKDVSDAVSAEAESPSPTPAAAVSVSQEGQTHDAPAPDAQVGQGAEPPKP